jgi:hypothetical protein
MTAFATSMKLMGVQMLPLAITTQQPLTMTAPAKHLMPWASAAARALLMSMAMGFAMTPTTAPTRLRATTTILPTKRAKAHLALAAQLFRHVTTTLRQQSAHPLAYTPLDVTRALATLTAQVKS